MAQTTTTKTQLIGLRGDLWAQINFVLQPGAAANFNITHFDRRSLKMLRYQFQICTYLHNNNNAAARVSYDKLLATQTDVLDGMMFEGHQHPTIVGDEQLAAQPDIVAPVYIGAPEHESENIRKIGEQFQATAKLYGDLLKTRVING